MQYFWAVLLCYLGIRDVSLTEETASRKGLLSRGLESRITHGYTAGKKDFPFQVEIMIKQYTDESFQCGGSLINTHWILTAAHCLRNTRHLYIFLGSTKDPNIEDNRRRQVLASEIYMHPKYDNKHLNDIALIQLATSLTFSDNIQPIRLANDELPQFSRVVASGWGKTHDAKGSNDLLYAHMITLPNQICEIEARNISGKLCAVSEKVPHESTCSGDSGGPLVFYAGRKKTPFLVGITSYGLSKDCETNTPEFFTDVYNFKDWIEDTIKNHSTPINHYRFY